ncbi:MAG: Gfo/Idh/MocA family oxidoreductase [Alphaproteobacteria bacterium]|nr:Gfo/Idh/MocA family oxidoreductase [Alphaproteobacteria bacterium]
MTSTIALALIGAGKFGRNYIRTIKGLPGMRLAAVASNNKETTALLPEGCEQVSDWRALPKRKDIDGIIIATPTPLHAEMILACLVSGKPVLCEKPLTLNFVEAETVAKAAERSKLPVQIDHIYLFHAAFQAMLAALARVGKLTRIEGIGGNIGPFRPDTTPRWDWGAHDLAMMLAVLRAAKLPTAPLRMEAKRLKQEQRPEGYGEIVQLDFVYETLSTRLTFGNIMEPKTRRFTLTGENGTLVFDDLAPQKLTLNGAPLPCDGKLPLDAAILRFADTVKKPAPEHSDHALGAEVVRLLERADHLLA